MNIDLIDILTSEDKIEISKAIKEKIVEGINVADFSKSGKLNINKGVNELIYDIFNNGDIYENMNMGSIANALGKKIEEGLK